MNEFEGLKGPPKSHKIHNYEVWSHFMAITSLHLHSVLWFAKHFEIYYLLCSLRQQVCAIDMEGPIPFYI